MKLTTMGRWYKSYERTKNCWVWTEVIGSNGYGRFWADGKLWLAHRFAFTLSGRLIPDGLVIDHICRNRMCVNPEHLRTLTSKENTLIGEGITAKRLRSPVCAKGHPWKPETTRINPKTYGRQCEICRSEGHKKYLENNVDKIKATRKQRWAERAV